MHEKLIKQLRNQQHCKNCPYTIDCNDFNSCLMDLLAADAIEDMAKRIVELETEIKLLTNLFLKQSALNTSAVNPDIPKTGLSTINPDIPKIGLSTANLKTSPRVFYI